MVWRVGLFYYAGGKTTPVSQIDDFVQEFNGVILLRTESNQRCDTTDLSTLIQRINDFWNQSPEYQIIAEIPNPHGECGYSQLKQWLDSVESQAGSKVRGYCLMPEGSWTMYNAQATDGNPCRKNVKQIVKIKQKNKYAVWIPVEGNQSFNWMDRCQSYIGFTNVAPQPHYYQVTDTTGDDKRPNGMNYSDLKTFMQNCKARGWGVEFECDNSVRGETENCMCKLSWVCTKRGANYYCASDDVGGFTYIYHYFSDDINNYRTVKNYYNQNPCPSGGYDTCAGV